MYSRSGNSHHRRSTHHHSRRTLDTHGSSKSTDYLSLPLEGIKSEEGDFNDNSSRRTGRVLNGSTTSFTSGQDSIKNDFDSESADLRTKIEEEMAQTKLYANTVLALEKEIENLQAEMLQLRDLEGHYKAQIQTHELKHKDSNLMISDLQKEV